LAGFGGLAGFSLTAFGAAGFSRATLPRAPATGRRSTTSGVAVAAFTNAGSSVCQAWPRWNASWLTPQAASALAFDVVATT